MQDDHNSNYEHFVYAIPAVLGFSIFMLTDSEKNYASWVIAIVSSFIEILLSMVTAVLACGVCCSMRGREAETMEGQETGLKAERKQTGIMELQMETFKYPMEDLKTIFLLWGGKSPTIIFL